MRWKKNTKNGPVKNRSTPDIFSKADKLDTSLVEINHLGLSDAGPVMSKTPHLSSQDVFVERLSCGT